ncbi:MAG: hypothetical protein ACRDUY_00395 [Nitriliruptorales bacterium]
MERRDDDYLTAHPVAATLLLVHARLAAGEEAPFELFAADLAPPVAEDAPFELLAAGIEPSTREPAQVS